MNIKLKDNSKWIEAEEKRKKKRIMSYITAILVLVTVAGGRAAYDHHREMTGSVYPGIELSEVPAGEPAVTVPDGYDKVLKVPDMPYTMMVPGMVAVEGDSFCIIVLNRHHIAVGKVGKDTATAGYLANAILPSIGYETVETLTFRGNRGYLNSRLVATEADTFNRNGASPIHSITIRILLGDTDIVLTGFTDGWDTQQLNDELLKIYSSIYQIDSGGAQAHATSGIKNLAGNEELHAAGAGSGVPMDADLIEEGEEFSIKDNPNQLYPADPDIQYRETEEATITVDRDMEMGVFVFNYVMDLKLNSILLYDPAGEIGYAPDAFQDYINPEYIFHIDHPMKGNWKVVYSAPGYIGTYQAAVFLPEAYHPQSELVQHTRDNDN